MRIETFVNFKLRSGRVLLAGIHDDAKEPFPEEIYEEIEKNRSTENRGRWTLRILDESAASSPDPDLMNTMDTQANTVDTSGTKKKRSRKK